MILLIWDSMGQDQIALYELFEVDAPLAQRCNGHYINEAHGLGPELDQALDQLYELITKRQQLHSGPGSFGPYTAIYISGFIP